MSNTIARVRDILFEELDMFRAGKSDISRAKVVTDMSAQAVYSFRVEVENKKIEMDLANADKQAKAWMNRDFSNISQMRKTA